MCRLRDILFCVKIYLSIIDKYLKLEQLNSSSTCVVSQLHFFKILYNKSSQDIITNAMNLVLYENQRSLWHLDRNSMFWEFECQKNGDDFFKVNFRMNRRSFVKLCAYLQHMGRKNSNFCASISLEKRVAIALYVLGSSAEYWSIGNLFGVAKSTVCSIFLEFCEKVWKALFPIYLQHFPLSRGKIEECLASFQELGFPQCLGALDGCHIEIHPKSDESVDYFNYKGWYSTVLLALVDSRFRRIGKGIVNKIENSNIVIKASCVLHNFLVMEKDAMVSSWLQDQNTIESGRRYPTYSTNLQNNSSTAELIRQALASHFSKNIYMIIN